MNPKDHVESVRHHLTLITSDPRWSIEDMATYVGDLVGDTADGHSIAVEVFDENHELAELRRTRNECFRVIGTGAIHLLKQGDGWERFHELMAALKAFIEQSEQFTSPASNPQYREGEEDGHAVAMVQLKEIIEMREGQ